MMYTGCAKKYLHVLDKSCTFARDLREINCRNDVRRHLSCIVGVSNQLFGVWRSWLAHLHGVQGVESSSLFTPTIFL